MNSSNVEQKKKFFLFFVFFFGVCFGFFFDKNCIQRVEAVHLDRRDRRLNFNPEAPEKLRANYGTGDQRRNGAASCFCFFSSAQSCRGRCDEPFRRGRVCECDPQCASYNTCCQDYQLQCRKRQNTHTQQQSGTVVEVAWVVVESETLQPHDVQIRSTQTFLGVTPAVYHVNHLLLSPQVLLRQSLTLGMFTLWGLRLTVSIACLFILIINQFVINLLLKHDLLNQVSESRFTVMDGFLFSNSFIAFVFSTGKGRSKKKQKNSNSESEEEYTGRKLLLHSSIS